MTLVNRIEDKPAREVCSQFGDDRRQLLEILHATQEKSGFLSDEALRTIANAVNISRAEIHGVVSFYHDFCREPAARVVVKICRAEACQAVGANDLLDQAMKEFGNNPMLDDVTIEPVYCLGNCALGPAVLVKEELFGRVTIEQVRSIVATGRGTS